MHVQSSIDQCIMQYTVHTISLDEAVCFGLATALAPILDGLPAAP